MKEKIEMVLDKLLKRKFYTLHDTYYDLTTEDLAFGSAHRFGGFYGSKRAAEKELEERGYRKVRVHVKTHSGWGVKPYNKVLWRKKEHYTRHGYFYATITEEHLDW